MYDISIGIKAMRLAELLPEPTADRILVALAPSVSKTKGGIVVPDQTKDREDSASGLGLVIKTGIDAFRNPEYFPSGAPYGVGDWVAFRTYTGTRFKVQGMEFRLMKDDGVEAVVKNPEEFERA